MVATAAAEEMAVLERARSHRGTFRLADRGRTCRGEDDLDAIEAQVKSTVDDAIDFARSSPFPDPGTAADFISSARGG